MHQPEMANPKELEEVRDKKFTRRVAMVTSIFAMLPAVTSLGGNHAMKEKSSFLSQNVFGICQCSSSAAVPGRKACQKHDAGNGPQKTKREEKGPSERLRCGPGRRSGNYSANRHKTCQERILGRRETFVAKAHHEGDESGVTHPHANVLDADGGYHRGIAFSDQCEDGKREVGECLHETKDPEGPVYSDPGYDAPAYQSARNSADQPKNLVHHAYIRAGETDVQQERGGHCPGYDVSQFINQYEKQHLDRPRALEIAG